MNVEAVVFDLDGVLVDSEELWDRALSVARESDVVDRGDRVVITAGTAVNVAGSTNVIKVDTA